VRKAVICVLGTALLAPFSISAQAVPELVLKAASAKLEEEFTLIGSVRELRDGGVLICDRPHHSCRRTDHPCVCFDRDSHEWTRFQVTPRSMSVRIEINGDAGLLR